MEIAKMLGLEQSLGVLAKQLEEATLEPPKDKGTAFTLACGEMLYFDHAVLNHTQRAQMVEKYRSFARELTQKIEVLAAHQVPGIYISPQGVSIMDEAVGRSTFRILSLDAPYKACFSRKHAVIVKLFYGVMNRKDKPPILMLDVRAEEWMVVRRKGEDTEFIPNGLLERVTGAEKG